MTDGAKVATDARKSPLKWHGSKNNMSWHICQLINNCPHRVYCEPFCGSAAVFFAKTFIPPVEILNDIDRRCVNFWRLVRSSPDELLARIAAAPCSSDFYNEQKKIMNAPAGEYSAADAAFAIWYCYQVGYGGMCHSFGMKAGAGTIKTFCRGESYRFAFEAAAWRLRHAQIVNRDAIELMNIVNEQGGANVLYYCDPPYSNTWRGDYVADDDRRADLLNFFKQCAGKFILSEFYSDDLEREAKNNGWSYRVIEQASSIKNRYGGGGKSEMLMYNFTPVGGDDALAPPPVLPLLE